MTIEEASFESTANLESFSKVGSCQLIKARRDGLKKRGKAGRGLQRISGRGLAI